MQVSSQVALRSYIVCAEDGRLYRRNRSYLYKVPESFQVLPDEDEVQSKVDTQTRRITRRPSEETPQLPTEPSALQMPAVSQPDPQPASPSVFLCLSLLEVAEMKGGLLSSGISLSRKPV